MQRAELLDRTGRWEECREEMAALVALPEPPPAVLAAFVEKLIRHGDFEQAAAQLKTLVAREPTAVGVIALEARLAVAQGDQPAAVAAVQRLADADKVSEKGSAKGPQQLLSVAALMQELGLDEEADAVFRQLAGQSAAGVLARADFLARRGRNVEALDLLQANRQRLTDASFLQAAVSVLRTADAATAAEQAARVDDWFAGAPRIDRDALGFALLRAELLAAQGRHEEAAALYKEQLARGDLPAAQRVIVQNNLAMQRIQPETAAEAKRLIDEAIAEQGPHPSLLDTRGLALLAGGASGEAVDVLREASLDRSVEKSLHLARALVADHDLDDARKVLLEAQKRGLDRRHLDADDRKRLGEVEAALGIPGPKS
jgi:tetratricopeptide (TPR) repeat protein